MKKTLLVLICVATVALTAHAQRGSQQRGQEMTPELRAEMMTRMMTERLDLSEDQMEKVHQINKARTKNSELMAARGQAEARKAEAMGKRAKAKQKAKKEVEPEKVEEEIEVLTDEDFDQEIEKVLSPEQLKKWEEVKKERRPSRDQERQGTPRGGGNRGGGN